MSFKVNQNTLIPRPETELLVEEAVNRLKGKKDSVVAEIGAGSGNIAVGIAKLADVERLYSCDISGDALFIAQENVCRHGLAAKIVLKQGDMFAAFASENLAGGVDMIVSNPPYVAQSEIEELAPELDYEPEIALFGGTDGMDFYKRLAAGAGEFLKPGGLLIVELNAKRSSAVRYIFEGAGYQVEALIKDYAGLDRILTLRKNNG
jgi:release factor glutamine methyltransferase